MVSTFDDIIFCLILLLPLAVFLAAAKKHWADVELKKAFWRGLAVSCFAFFVSRFAYTPIGMYLGGDIRNFVLASKDWYLSLIACIGIMGLIEEGCKALFALVVCIIGKSEGFRPSYMFMSFAGCALGFSVLENILCYFDFGPSVVLPRVLISSVAHLTFSCVCAYFSFMAFTFMKGPLTIKAVVLWNIGIVSSAILHGVFNFMLFNFSALSLSGLILAAISLFLYMVHEIWIQALRYDVPPVAFLAVCSVCRALTIERIRFCPFCGNRVSRINDFPTVIKK